MEQKSLLRVICLTNNFLCVYTILLDFYFYNFMHSFYFAIILAINKQYRTIILEK